MKTDLKLKQFWCQYVASAAISVSTLVSGMGIGWMSTIGDQGAELSKAYGLPITTEQFSWLSSSTSLGAAISFIVYQQLSKTIGRKKLVLAAVIPFIIAWLLILFPSSAWSFVIGRLFLGLSGGAYLYLCPLYITEIGEKTIRGRLSTFFEFSHLLGYLLAYVLALFFDIPTVSIICCSTMILFVVPFAFMPESPIFWLQQDDEQAARESLTRLRGTSYPVEAELQELREFVETSRGRTPFWIAMSTSKVARKAVLISCGIMALQQLSGISVVLYYSVSIMNKAYSPGNALVTLAIITVLRLLASSLTGLVIDRFGRRVTLLLSAIPVTVASFVIAIYFQLQSSHAVNLDGEQWIPAAAVCIYLASFSFAFGSFPLFVSTEFLPASVKDMGFCISSTIGQLCSFAVLKSYAGLDNLDEFYWAFYGFGLINCLAIAFIVLLIPETRKRTFAKIQREMNGQEISHKLNKL